MGYYEERYDAACSQMWEALRDCDAGLYGNNETDCFTLSVNVMRRQKEQIEELSKALKKEKAERKEQVRKVIADLEDWIRD